MAAEFTWRKKELIQLKTMVSENEKTPHRDFSIRAAIPLLYAHWEGFIKRIGTFYLEYTARQGKKHHELSDNFLALALEPMVKKAQEANKLSYCLDVVRFFRLNMNESGVIRWRTCISTESNLSSLVLEEIVTRLGLDYSRFATKANLIDEILLDNRNNIAHGERLMVDWSTYMSLHDEVFGMMQDYYNQIENIVISNSSATRR